MRAVQPPDVSFEGNRTGLIHDAFVEYLFRLTDDGLTTTLNVDPLAGRPLETLDFDEIADLTARAGQLRKFDVPRHLYFFTKYLRDAVVIPGKRPFWKYRLYPQGEWLPVSYQPHGPWKLEAEREPFDLSTTASLAIPQRYLHHRPLVDHLEELYNSHYPFVRPAIVTARFNQD